MRGLVTSASSALVTGIPITRVASGACPLQLRLAAPRRIGQQRDLQGLRKLSGRSRPIREQTSIPSTALSGSQREESRL